MKKALVIIVVRTAPETKASSGAANNDYRDNYDRIFKKDTQTAPN